MKTYIKITICFIILFLYNCSKMPSGPAIPEVQELGIFCVLNPAIPAQTIHIGHSLTYQQTLDKVSVDTDVNNAEINLSGPDGRFQIQTMPEQSDHTEQTLLNTSIYLSGTSKFNYIGTDQKVQSGETYSISVHSEQYGTVNAETTIPGPFEITNMNLDPNTTREKWFYEVFNQDGDRPDFFRVEWTDSDNAEGYLVDISVIVYDVPALLQMPRYRPWFRGHYPGSTFSDMNFSSQPTDFAIKYDNCYQRGYLTKENKIEISRELFKQMIEFKDSYYYRYQHIKRMIVSVHAVDKAFYNFLAFQFYKDASEQVIGQESMVPDISNVVGGMGVFGSCQTRSAICRQYEIILMDYREYKELSARSDNKNEPYARAANRFIADEDPKLDLFPQEKTVLQPGETLQLSWQERNKKYDYYVVTLKPRYLWFWPANMNFYIQGNNLDINWDDFPIRDCEVEWYVKAAKPGYNFVPQNLYVSLSAFKAPELLSPVDFTDWSESAYFAVASGKLDGFESQKPEGSAAGTTFHQNDYLQWSSVNGADGYLLYLTDSTGKETVLFSKTSQIQLGESESLPYIEGMEWQSSFVFGESYSCRICAVRIKTGAFGIYVQSKGSGALPELLPRHQHPSGLVQQSQWSNIITLAIE